jgi:hypothetical protein
VAIAAVVVLLTTLVVGLRLLPGSPLAAKAAVRWQDPTPATAPAQPSTPRPTPAGTTEAPLPPLPVKATDVRIEASGWYSWALLDTRTGQLSGPADRTDLSTTASLIKAWIGADFLRRAAA